MVFGIQVRLFMFWFSRNKYLSFWPAVIENCGVATPNISSKKVQKQVEILQEENNLLKLKLEVLMNLIAESIADYLSTHSSTH